MPLSWKLYRLVCIAQIILATYFLFTSFIDFFGGGLIRVLVFLFIIAIAVLGINILGNNYPNVPVTGKQKSTFNWLFLLNFLFLAFLFGFIIAEYKALKRFSSLIDKSIFSLPFELTGILVAYLLVLLFQFIILYGLYSLRRSLYENFIKQEFEFEKK